MLRFDQIYQENLKSINILVKNAYADKIYSKCTFMRWTTAMSSQMVVARGKSKRGWVQQKFTINKGCSSQFSIQFC